MSLFVPLPSDHLATPLVRAVLPQPGGGGEACPPLSFPSWVTSSTGMGEGILEAERLALLGSVRVFYEDRHFSVGSGCGVLGFFGAPCGDGCTCWLWFLPGHAPLSLPVGSSASDPVRVPILPGPKPLTLASCPP